MSEPRIQGLPLSLIRIDANTQSRVGVSTELIDEYAEAWLHSAEFPPLDVFMSRDGGYYLADGFHRYLAAKKVAKTSVLCRVFRGSARDAFLFACTTNQSHGLRRTNADKRYMVCRFLNDPTWVTWTDSRIAEHCGVSHTFVSTLRRELESIQESPAAIAKNQRREGSDGKSYPPERAGDRVPTRSINEVSSTHYRRVHSTRRKAIASLNQIRKCLTILGLDGRHAAALDAVEADLRVDQ